MAANEIIALALAFAGIGYAVWYVFFGGLASHVDNYLRLLGINPDEQPTHEEAIAWERETSYGADGRDFHTWRQARRATPVTITGPEGS